MYLFLVELEKQTYCVLEVENNRLHSVAFKVKTNSPEKYIVCPNKGVIQPWQICLVRVTLQPQKEYPPNMQCKDKFLIQSTIVDPHDEVDDLSQDTFTKDCGWSIEECKVKVTYVYHEASIDDSEDDQETFRIGKRDYEDNTDVSKRRNPLFSFLFSFLVVVVGFSVGFILKLLSEE
ncbi:vesicle-associated protein 2-1-like [Impatiens glandulifera]|uniref:vesicle-associated protein 2-1-like n=1 Tax=Impatiens glandulifera TaxID=253017 RepID=UPI001FB088D3|nr:vesicle-associated protein 2-1-like [Impatiens glandulifera]